MIRWNCFDCHLVLSHGKLLAHIDKQITFCGPTTGNIFHVFLLYYTSYGSTNRWVIKTLHANTSKCKKFVAHCTCT